MATETLPASAGIWDDCKLGREEVAERFTNLLHNTEGSKVIALNAPYGFGKTFFLERWAKHLRAEEGNPFVVMEFSAWDVDFADHALVPLVYTLMEELKNQKLLDEQSELYVKFSRVATDVVKHVVKEKTGVDVDSISLGGASFEFNDFIKRKDAMAEFKSVLKEVVVECRSKKDQKLVIIIDELERCRPTFAIQLLEVVKHLFDVEGIIFVLGTDREQLGHTISNIYGQKFNSDGYLRRFIEHELVFPEPEMNKYVNFLHSNKTGLNQFLPSGTDLFCGGETLKQALLFNFKCLNFSLREVEQCYEEINTIIRMLDLSKYNFFPPLFSFLVCVKYKNEKFYKQLCTNKISYDDAIRVFDEIYGIDVDNRVLKHTRIQILFGLDNDYEKFVQRRNNEIEKLTGTVLIETEIEYSKADKACYPEAAHYSYDRMLMDKSRIQILKELIALVPPSH